MESHLRRAVVLVSLAALGACVKQPTDASRKRSGPEDDDLGPAKQVEMTNVLTFDVTALPENASFLREYAKGTGLEEKTGPNGSVVVGPILSRFEASWIAGCTPNAAVSYHDSFGEPGTPDPWRKGSESAARWPVGVQMRGALGERFAIVAFESRITLPDGTPGTTVDHELHQTETDGPHMISKLPDKMAKDSPAAGLVIAKHGRDLVYISAANNKRDDMVRGERLVAWRKDGGERNGLFEKPFLFYTHPDGGFPTMRIGRIVPGEGSVSIAMYRVEITLTDAAKGIDIDLNDWSDAKWKDKPTPELCKLKGATHEKDEKLSLE